MNSNTLQIIATAGIALIAQSESATLRWQPNTEPDIYGYEVRVMRGDSVETVKTQTPSIEWNFLGGDKVSIAAINTSGLKSGFSEAVTYQPESADLSVSERITIRFYSSDTPGRKEPREEAVLHQPINESRRFWWAEITR